MCNGNNQTSVTEFILMGFSSYPFLDPALKSPMYICFNSVIVPKMLADLILQKKTISYIGCFTLLKVCFQLAVASWFLGFPNSTVSAITVFSVPYCGPNTVNHFFCDSPPLLELACADTYIVQTETLTATVIFIELLFLIILFTYACIIITILRIPSAEGRQKAFSTCSSHLLVITLYYGTAISTYFNPKSKNLPDTKKFISLSYTVITPMLNPIIYSLRNKEVKAAMKRTLHQKMSRTK
uniref:G-protein coupled receptors family 1 profile domain-containing protein n=1 Tax=Naja naja TaxID=35670 RepID=A0A8C6XAF1_NAJNA